MSWSYSFDPTTSDVDAVRFEIQDTNASSPLLQNEEIAAAILRETGSAAATPAALLDGPLFASAARCMEALARLFSAQADQQVGELQINYSRQADGYTKRAKELRAKAQGFHAPTSGGLSESAKQAEQDDPDRVQPAFYKDQFDSPYTGPQVDPVSPLWDESLPG